MAGQPPKQLIEKYGGFEYMLRNALAEALANIPRHDWHPKISLHLQAFNIMMAEFPDISQLDDGVWDAMVVTGSRMYFFYHADSQRYSLFCYRRKPYVDGGIE